MDISSPNHKLVTSFEEKQMEITQNKQNGTVIVSIQGRMDAITAPAFDRELEQIMNAGEISLVVDMNALDYISSAGLRSFLMVAKKLKGVSGKIVLASPREVVRDVFGISGFNQIFPIADSIEEALAAME